MDTAFEQAYNDGMGKGIKKGMEKGSKDREREIARQMKLAGEPADKISTFTGLPTDEIDGP